MKTLLSLLVILVSMQISTAADKKAEKKDANRKPASAGRFYCDASGDLRNPDELSKEMNGFCDSSKLFSVSPRGSGYLFCCIAK